MATIRRNATRQIAAIKEKRLCCRVYTESNDFVGAEVDPQRAWEALDRFDFAKLTVGGDGRDGVRWTVHVHDNHWYYLTEETGP